jgi:hypothetical protein
VAVDDDPVAVEVDARQRLRQRVALEAFVLDATAGCCRRPTWPSPTSCSGPVEAVLPRLRTQQAITSGYLAGERPAAPGWIRVECRELDGWAADLFCRETV